LILKDSLWSLKFRLSLGVVVISVGERMRSKGYLMAVQEKPVLEKNASV